MMKLRNLAPILAALALATASTSHTAFAATTTANAAAEEKVVYHVNDSDNAIAAMRNIGNHIDASPSVKIVVVTHSKGIDFLLNEAKDKNGNPYEPIVQRLKDKGVDFRVCNNTLVSRKIDASSVIREASIVPSGVAEIGRLQAKEGYVYLKP
jgi:intracellular sulfur oxidation DsrE/DsrF family protein